MTLVAADLFVDSIAYVRYIIILILYSINLSNKIVIRLLDTIYQVRYDTLLNQVYIFHIM